MIIGAFLAGLFIREEIIDHETFEKIEDRVYGLSYSFVGPIFFASLAFHLDSTSIKESPLFLIVIITVAVLGKLIGCGLASHLSGLSKNESIAMGLVMNSRGAVELIIASIGLQLQIIDETVFSVLIIMAFATKILSLVATPPFAKQLQTT